MANGTINKTSKEWKQILNTQSGTATVPNDAVEFLAVLTQPEYQNRVLGSGILPVSRFTNCPVGSSTDNAGLMMLFEGSNLRSGLYRSGQNEIGVRTVSGPFYTVVYCR